MRISNRPAAICQRKVPLVEPGADSAPHRGNFISHTAELALFQFERTSPDRELIPRSCKRKLPWGKLAQGVRPKSRRAAVAASPSIPTPGPALQEQLFHRRKQNRSRVPVKADAKKKLSIRLLEVTSGKDRPWLEEESTVGRKSKNQATRLAKDARLCRSGAGFAYSDRVRIALRNNSESLRHPR